MTAPENISIGKIHQLSEDTRTIAHLSAMNVEYASIVSALLKYCTQLENALAEKNRAEKNSSPIEKDLGIPEL